MSTEDSHRDIGRYISILLSGEVPPELPFDAPCGSELNLLRNHMLHNFDERERMNRSIRLESDQIQVLEDSQRLYQEVFNRSVTGIIIVSEQGRIVDVNNATEGMLGYRADELRKLSLSDISLPQDRNIDAEMIVDLLEGRRTYYNIEKRYLRSDDILLWVLLTVFAVKQSNGSQSLVIMLEDISARKSAELHLEYVSTHDSLTDLYNRAFFDQEFHRIQFSQALPVSIMIVDVDGLKLLNDTKGHEAGDKLIVGVARILKEAFRGDDIVARIGGDEFAAILPETGELDVQHLLARIAKCRERHNTANPRNAVEFSVGVATSLKGTDAQAVFKLADERMYADKIQRKAARKAAEELAAQS